MHKIKKYNEKELQELLERYNSLVKDEFQIDKQAYLSMINEASKQESSSPYYSIPATETKSGITCVVNFHTVE